uniref:SCP domain-containing protein n=1 Tax=Mesocestoides corti TaxID=53468 RepID=A0A5K3EFP4_MESCO
MLKLVCITVLLWNVLAEVPSEKEREYIINLHTELREEVNPPASNMLMLSYSNDLEKLADDWAEHGTVQFSTLSLSPKHKSLGIVYRIGPINQPLSFGNLSELKQERQNYDYKANSCKKVCFSYKQAIWAKSSEVGCAKYRRPLGLSEDYYYRVVCLYRPGEEFPTGLPYENGVSCSKCPEGYVCERKQCTKQSATKSISAKTTTAASRRLIAVGIIHFAMLILLFVA